MKTIKMASQLDTSYENDYQNTEIIYHHFKMGEKTKKNNMISKEAARICTHDTVQSLKTFFL